MMKNIYVVIVTFFPLEASYDQFYIHNIVFFLFTLYHRALHIGLFALRDPAFAQTISVEANCMERSTDDNTNCMAKL